MTTLGYPVYQIAIAAGVAGFCWTLASCIASFLWSAVTRGRQ